MHRTLLTVAKGWYPQLSVLKDLQASGKKYDGTCRIIFFRDLGRFAKFFKCQLFPMYTDIFEYNDFSVYIFV